MKIEFAYRFALGLLALVLVAMFSTGCETTSFERGVITGEVAKLAFDAPQDERKFREIKADIVAALASSVPITAQVVSDYVAEIKLDFSPAMWQIVQRRLDAELPEVEIPGVGELDDTRIREFLTGVAAAL